MTGYFSDDSVIRRVGGEAVLMLGGGRALLMQAAHPLVAAGIVGHSRYRAEPWRRLARTMTALYTIVFGTRRDANEAGAAVRAVHARVHGRLAQRVGPFPRGTPYSAADPDLMLWVHSTLVDTGLVMHETFVAPLDAADQDAFVADMAVVARVFGVPAGLAPESLAELRAYQDERYGGGELVAGDDAHEIAATVLRPPLPLPLRPPVALAARASLPLVPEPIRDVYGLPCGRLERAALQASSSTVRRLVLPALPGRVRRLVRDGERALPFTLLSAFAR